VNKIDEIIARIQDAETMSDILNAMDFLTQWNSHMTHIGEVDRVRSAIHDRMQEHRFMDHA